MPDVLMSMLMMPPRCIPEPIFGARRERPLSPASSDGGMDQDGKTQQPGASQQRRSSSGGGGGPASGTSHAAALALLSDFPYWAPVQVRATGTAAAVMSPFFFEPLSLKRISSSSSAFSRLAVV